MLILQGAIFGPKFENYNPQRKGEGGNDQNDKNNRSKTIFKLLTIRLKS